MSLHHVLRALVMGALMAVCLVPSAFASPPAGVVTAPPHQAGTDGATLFQTKCAACHTVGKGKLVGPDLKDVTVRRDPSWVKGFITDPNKYFAANDPIALQLLSESNNVKMPPPGLSVAEVDALLVLLSGATPVTATAPVSTPLGITGDPAVGRRIFTGEQPLLGGGPACLGCHSVSGIAPLGGGALGPNLTNVVQRYPGAGLTAVLNTIAFPTMAGPFANRPLSTREQADLVAFLTEADQQQAPVTAFGAGALTAETGLLFGIGLGGTALLTAVLAPFWLRQRQGLSARLRAAARRANDD